MSIRVSGLNETVARMRSFKASSLVSAIIDETMRDVERDAKMLSPVKTGAMRSSIQSFKFSETKGYVFVDVPYARFVELGTVKMSAKPYLRPALEKNRLAFLQKLKIRLG